MKKEEQRIEKRSKENKGNRQTERRKGKKEKQKKGKRRTEKRKRGDKERQNTGYQKQKGKNTVMNKIQPEGWTQDKEVETGKYTESFNNILQVKFMTLIERNFLQKEQNYVRWQVAGFMKLNPWFKGVDAKAISSPNFKILKHQHTIILSAQAGAGTS